MEKEILDKLKKDYDDIVGAINTDFHEIEELEKNPIIRRYFKLKEWRLTAYHGYLKNDYRIIYYLMNSEIKDTNGIYVYMWSDTLGNFEKNSGKSFDNISLDKDIIVIYYVDLENSSKWELVMAEDQEEFERTHNVITGENSILDPGSRYSKAQIQFLDDCLKSGQEKAVESVLIRYRKRS